MIHCPANQLHHVHIDLFHCGGQIPREDLDRRLDAFQRIPVV